MLSCICSFSYAQIDIKTHSFSEEITSISNTTKGQIILGTAKGNIYEYDGILPVLLNSVPSRINKIIVKSDLWTILTKEGMYELDEEKIKLVSGTHLNILDISEDKEWMITSRGIYTKQGSDYIPDKEYFSDINFIKNGRFFTVRDRLMILVDDKIFEKEKNWKLSISLPRKQLEILPKGGSYLLADMESIVEIDHKNYIDSLIGGLPMVTMKLFRNHKNETQVARNDSLFRLNSDIPSLEVISGNIITNQLSTYIQDDWDNQWLLNGKEILQLKTGASNDPPLVWIKTLLANEENHSLDKKVSFAKEENEIEITFNGLHYSDPAMLSFEYRLTKNGKANEWINLGRKRSLTLKNLTKGSYIIELRSSIEKNNYAYAPSLKVEVQNDFIFKTVLGFLGIALTMLAMALFFNSRYEKLKRRSEEERQKLIAQNKMLTLQQKALQLQMNPHFVFNALNSIQGLIAKEDNKRARQYLRHFSKMMRGVLNHSRVDKVSLVDEISYLTDYLELEKMASGDRFTFNIDIADNVEMNTMIPTMIIQPFVENAIVHGVKSLTSRAGKIHISITQDGRKLHCIVSDNGIGREASAQKKSTNHKSIAVDLAKERLGNTPLIKNSIVYRDLKEGDTPIGTAVDIFILGS